MIYEKDVLEYPGNSHSRRPATDEEQPAAPQWQNDMQRLIDKFEVDEETVFAKQINSIDDKDDDDEDGPNEESTT